MAISHVLEANSKFNIDSFSESEQQLDIYIESGSLSKLERISHGPMNWTCLPRIAGRNRAIFAEGHVDVVLTFQCWP